jgi:hypothetical protein
MGPRSLSKTVTPRAASLSASPEAEAAYVRMANDAYFNP